MKIKDDTYEADYKHIQIDIHTCMQTLVLILILFLIISPNLSTLIHLQTSVHIHVL